MWKTKIGFQVRRKYKALVVFYIFICLSAFSCSFVYSYFFTPNDFFTPKIIVEGNHVFKIKNCIYNQTRNFVVKDKATLIIENATLFAGAGWRCYRIFDEATVNIVDSTLNHSLEFDVYNHSSIQITNSSVQDWIELYDDSSVQIVNSTAKRLGAFGNNSVQITNSIIQTMQVHGSPSINISSSNVGDICLRFISDSNLTLNNLQPGLISYWNLQENNAVTKAYLDVTIQNTNVTGWKIGTYDNSLVRIVNSALIRAYSCDDSSIRIINSRIERYVDAHDNPTFWILNTTIPRTYLDQARKFWIGWSLEVTVLSVDGKPQENVMTQVFFNHNGTLAADAITGSNGKTRFELPEKIGYSKNLVETEYGVITEYVGKYVVKATYEDSSIERNVLLNKPSEVIIKLV